MKSNYRNIKEKCELISFYSNFQAALRLRFLIHMYIRKSQEIWDSINTVYHFESIAKKT